MFKNPQIASQLIFAALILFFAYLILNYIPYLMLGGILTLACHPLFRFLIKKNLGTMTAALITGFAVGLIFLVPLSALSLIGAKLAIQQVPQLLEEFRTSSNSGQFANLPIVGWFSGLEQSLGVDSSELRKILFEASQTIGTKLTEILGKFLTKVPSSFLSATLTIVSLLYFLIKGSSFTSLIKTFLPFTEEQTEHLFSKIEVISRSLILATVVTGSFQALFFTLGCAIAGISNLALIGFGIFIMSFIPIVGSAPLTLSLTLGQFLYGHMGTGVLLLIFAIATSTVDTFIRPYFLRKGANLDPFLALLSLLGGLDFFGFPGLFLGPLLLGVLIEIYQVAHPIQPSHSTPRAHSVPATHSNQPNR